MQKMGRGSMRPKDTYELAQNLWLCLKDVTIPNTTMKLKSWLSEKSVEIYSELPLTLSMEDLKTLVDEFAEKEKLWTMEARRRKAVEDAHMQQGGGWPNHDREPKNGDVHRYDDSKPYKKKRERRRNQDRPWGNGRPRRGRGRGQGPRHQPPAVVFLAI